MTCVGSRSSLSPWHAAPLRRRRASPRLRRRWCSRCRSKETSSRRALARKESAHTPFVLTLERKRASPVFVFVAKDDAEMRALDDAFAALDRLHPGVWRP